MFTTTQAPLNTSQDYALSLKAVIGERLGLEAFMQLAGRVAGYPFVKVVIDRPNQKIHFINNAVYKFHADYIAENFFSMTPEAMELEIDKWNKTFYVDPDRRFYLAVIALHARADRRFFSLETVEVDTMDREMLRYLYETVRENLDPSMPLLLKPANHQQEAMMKEIDPKVLPRIFSHELFATSEFVCLNPGKATGRLRVFANEDEYQQRKGSLDWHDIIVMDRVPDDIPRVGGIINSSHTTPLSHTNVLAAGWQVPNCTQLGILRKIQSSGLDGRWVTYTVTSDASEVSIQEIERPEDLQQNKPTWTAVRITLEEPEVSHTKIVNLDTLRTSDRHKYGTKAANIGEIHDILKNGSERLTAFYGVPRPPRPNLYPYLAKMLGEQIPLNDRDQISEAANEFVRRNIRVPRGIAIPFAIQQEFLESSPKIQQGIGKLKMAIELGAHEVDAICVTLQQMIKATRMPDRLRRYIDGEIAKNLAGVSSFVVRSSSNAEDLAGFSAAGIYESINHVTSADNIFESIKKVWASLVSARSTRLRQEVGISLDDSYMGVVIQEEVKSEMGGVLVTTNPMNRADFRNVYFNVSTRSVNQVVEGSELPLQYLYNTVEGGGRTVSLGSSSQDLNDAQKRTLSQLSLAGRFLQSHFSPDYTFSAPVDIEWIAGKDEIYILQLRPYTR
jgi:Pyruvate phosphate dikinase, AMP/ATP-binding domain